MKKTAILDSIKDNLTSTEGWMRQFLKVKTDTSCVFCAGESLDILTEYGGCQICGRGSIDKETE